MVKTWDDETIERLKKLVADGGYTASQIGERLGINRSQVLGKLHRLKLSLKSDKPRQRSLLPPKPKAPRPERSARAKPAFVAAVEEWPLPAADDVARKPLADLEANECRFPVGDPGTKGFGFCASERVPGLPYCAGQAARCFVPPNNLKSRRKDTSEDAADTGHGRVLPASELV